MYQSAPAAFPRSTWLDSLPAAERGALLDAANRHRIWAGEFAYRQGQDVEPHSSAFFGVASGVLKLSMLDDGGREAILAIIEPGSWVGEVAILNRSPRAQSVVAMSDAEVFTVSAANFLQLMKRAGFAEGIARLVAGRFSVISGIMGDSSLLSLRGRLARRLVMLVHGDTAESPDFRASVSVSQNVLAMLLGVSRVTLNKELHALAVLGAVELHYGRIDIKKLALLVEIGDRGGRG